ncbi:MAG TPA: RES family NAD+ phosphorylase [Thermoanaerobaculia bacterium]|nr:RES family NAD+ phosphorylase [Thermoanaerobaculia bacterium]
MLTAWRIVKAKFADEAFTGDRSLVTAGRWHSAGTRVIYTAESVSLATLEILVHLDPGRPFPEYVVIPCYFHEVLVEELDLTQLPENWFTTVSPPALRIFGDRWARDRVSAVLKVPSAVTRVEFNYLLNPEHPDFRSIDIGEPRAVVLDERLLT